MIQTLRRLFQTLRAMRRFLESLKKELNGMVAWQPEAPEEEFWEEVQYLLEEINGLLLKG